MSERCRCEEGNVLTGWMSWRQKEGKKLRNVNPANPPVVDAARARDSGKFQHRGQTSSVPTLHRNWRCRTCSVALRQSSIRG